MLQLARDVAQQANKKKISLSEDIAFMPGGVNGPYFDLETPVRNTTHWLITFSVLYQLDQKKDYKKTALQLCNFLLQNKQYREKLFYIHRQKEGKDVSNGVIGQAWVVEALAVAGKIFDINEAKQLAVECANSLDFVNKTGAWERPELQGYKSQIDYTLNHQLWFAAAKAQALQGEPNPDIETFLTALDSGAFRIRKTGQIRHLFYANSVKGLLLQGRYKLIENRNRNHIFEKEAGYHLYNLHPLARLKHFYPDHDFFQNKWFLKAIRYTATQQFRKSQMNNMYSYPYNAPAFESPLVFLVFKDNFDEDLESTIQYFIDKQIELTYDSTSKWFNRHNPDSLTLSARIYEWMFVPLLLNQKI